MSTEPRAPLRKSSGGGSHRKDSRGSSASCRSNHRIPEERVIEDTPSHSRCVGSAAGG